jgi:hypothetical protein
VATITLSSLGSIITSGWAGNGLTFTKLYEHNATGEVVVFQDVNEANTGSVIVNIDRIIDTDITPPYAVSVGYTPDGPTLTTGNVLVSVFISEPIQPLTGWTNLIGNLRVKNFADNFSGMLTFWDMGGNSGQT